MKRAVILHGTDGGPKLIWIPWLKQHLESRGYEVWAPELPNNHTPNRQVYNDFLFSSNWDFTDNLLIGHSSGAVSVFNLLQDERCPKIRAGVMVGVWTDTRPTDLDQVQFKNLFPPDGFNAGLLKSKAGKMLFLHGDNDPFCPLDQAKAIAEKTNSEIIIIPNGLHLGRNRDPEFPELLEALETKIGL